LFSRGERRAELRHNPATRGDGGERIAELLRNPATGGNPATRWRAIDLPRWLRVHRAFFL
jgi:hypothetical protein